MPTSEGRLTRIGVFCDGNIFFHVSNYYNYTVAALVALVVDPRHSECVKD